MPNPKISNEEAKNIILERIDSGIDFRTLRKELRGLSRRTIKLLVLEIMAEQKISEVPFAGLMRKPVKAPQPLLINSDGMIDVNELLAKKNYSQENCFVKYSLGPKKITMTIKEKKDNNVRTTTAE